MKFYFVFDVLDSFCGFSLYFTHLYHSFLDLMSRTSTKKQNFSRRRKRKWNGLVPQPRPHRNIVVTVPQSCSSERKLSNKGFDNLHQSTKDVDSPPQSNQDFFMLVNFKILEDLFRELACPDCAADIKIHNDTTKRHGFAHHLSIKCTICDWVKSIYTSPSANNVRGHGCRQGRKPFDVNIQPTLPIFGEFSAIIDLVSEKLKFFLLKKCLY